MTEIRKRLRIGGSGLTSLAALALATSSVEFVGQGVTNTYGTVITDNRGRRAEKKARAAAKVEAKRKRKLEKQNEPQV